MLDSEDEPDTPFQQQGQAKFGGEGGGHLICQTARIPICAKVACYFKIKANGSGLFEYKLPAVDMTGPKTR